jgi:hypothetical protein
VVVLLGLIIVILILGTFRQIIVAADQAANGVIEDGYSITTVQRRIGAIRIIVLNIVAWPATIEWRGSSPVPSAIKTNPHCIMYLGKANGTTVLYNVKNAATIRFPSEDAIITINPQAERLSPSCYE